MTDNQGWARLKLGARSSSRSPVLVAGTQASRSSPDNLPEYTFVGRWNQEPESGLKSQTLIRNAGNHAESSLQSLLWVPLVLASQLQGP